MLCNISKLLAPGADMFTNSKSNCLLRILGQPCLLEVEELM